MELRQHNAEMMCLFNHFLNKWLLVLEVWLVLQNSTATTCYCLKITFCLALASNSLSWYASLCKNMAEIFWLVWICWMVSGKYHGLADHLPIMQIPAIVWASLCSSWIYIHLAHKQGIFGVCWMPLRVVNHDNSLISWPMGFFECRNNLFSQLLFCEIRTNSIK